MRAALLVAVPESRRAQRILRTEVEENPPALSTSLVRVLRRGRAPPAVGAVVMDSAMQARPVDHLRCRPGAVFRTRGGHDTNRMSSAYVVAIATVPRGGHVKAHFIQ